MSVPFDGFIATLIESVHSLEPLEIPLLEAVGCSVASDVVAAADMPASSVAKVDGYCVRRSDIEGASASTPVVLPIVADIEPGQRPSVSVQPGFGVRITAGSAIPDGTQCVVPTEWTDGGVARVSISQVPTLDDFIMPAGGVVKDSTVLVPAHTRLRSSHLGLIAAAGSDRVLVNPRPRIVVIPVGSELVEPGNRLGPGQVSEASGSLITAALRNAGALAFRIPALPTDARTLAATIEDQLVRADLVVLVDGAGARTRSVVRDVVNRIGGVEFTDLACEPIGVLGHGRVGPDAIPVVVVPSDPLAAYVAIEMILRPVVRRMLGLEPVHRPVIRAMLKGTIETSPTARSFIPATVSFDQGAYVVTATPTTGHPLIATSRSSAFAVVPEGVGHASDGLMVDVVVLERRFA